MDTKDNFLKALEALDRDELMMRMSEELPVISGELKMKTGDIAWRTGLDNKRLSMITSGKRKMKWSEYLSILFFLWGDEKGRDIVEERGLFPELLRNALSVDRNSH